jgi:hypothetical protein
MRNSRHTRILLTDPSHANAHCIMKILKGSLTETRYAWPTVDRNNAEDRPLQVLSSKTYEENQVTYMSDKLGLHRISNPDANDYAVSLHRKLTTLPHVEPRLIKPSVHTSERGGIRLQCFQRRERPLNAHQQVHRVL